MGYVPNLPLLESCMYWCYRIVEKKLLILEFGVNKKKQASRYFYLILELIRETNYLVVINRRGFLDFWRSSSWSSVTGIGNSALQPLHTAKARPPRKTTILDLSLISPSVALTSTSPHRQIKRCSILIEQPHCYTVYLVAVEILFALLVLVYPVPFDDALTTLASAFHVHELGSCAPID